MLERDGWLVKTERKAGGRNLSNLYQIDVEKLEAAAEAARAYYKTAKKQASRTIPLNIDFLTVEGSTVDKNEGVNPPMIDSDPLLTTDPSDKRSSCPDASPPDSSDNDFHQDMLKPVVYSARKRQWEVMKI